MDTLAVAVDPGKALNRVWLSTDSDGLLLDPLTLPVLRSGIDELTRLIQLHRGDRDPVIAIVTRSCNPYDYICQDPGTTM